MTKEQNEKFEKLNDCWVLIKPYVKDREKEYKIIMSDYFKMFFLKRPGEKFSDEWWDSTTDIINYPEKLKGDQELCTFAAELSVSLLDYFRQEQMISNSYLKEMTLDDFTAYIGRAFIKAGKELIK